VTFAVGEELRTEISAKFTRTRLEGDLAAAGMKLVNVHTDSKRRYALSLARPLPI
jgi:L-histidine N-alpha-methyltransferase